MFRKKNSDIIKKISNIASDFDRSFDNTVVDTFAFEKALHSKKLILFLIAQFTQPYAEEMFNLTDIANQTGKLIIQ